MGWGVGVGGLRTVLVPISGTWRKDAADDLLWGPRSGGAQGSTHGTYK